MEIYLAGLAARAGAVFCLSLAAFLQSITGFGLVVVAAPLLMFFYDARLVVPIMLLLAFCSNFVQGLFYIRRANRPLILILYLGVLLGQPFGFFVYNHMNNDTLKLMISTFLLLSLFFLQLRHIHIQENTRHSLITGFFSGFSSITTGMGGPPMLIYLAYSQMPQEIFRATCFVFFFLCNITSLSSYLLGGLPFHTALEEFFYLLPGVALGILLGHAVYDYIPKKLIHHMIFIFLYLTSIYMILTTLFHLHP